MNATDFFEEWYGKITSGDIPNTKYILKSAYLDGYAKGRQHSPKSEDEWLQNSYIAELQEKVN